MHFLLAGAAIFAVLTASATEDASPPGRIEVSEASVGRMVAAFEATWRRPPNDRELAAMIEDHVREEIYVREALALGLDQDDAVIRRRLRQKMEFLSASIAGSVEPTEEDLRTYFAENAQAYAVPARLEFEQIFLGERAGDAEAEAVREALTGGADPNTLGQHTMLPPVLGPAVAPMIDRNFGTGFSDRIATLDVGAWHGPVRSSFGLHFVRLLGRLPATEPEYDAVKDRVRDDWRRANVERITEVAFEHLRKRYEIVRPDGARP